jgi:Protein of unknown function (DUF4232)
MKNTALVIPILFGIITVALEQNITHVEKNIKTDRMAKNAIISNKIQLTESPTVQLSIQTHAAENISFCQTSQLSLKREGIEGGMGHAGAIYVFKNTSSSTCNLYGYPKLMLLDKNGQPLKGAKIKLSTNNYFHSAQQQPVVLEPNEKASFIVSSTHISQTKQSCPVSTKAKITAPNTSRQFTIVERIRLCDAISITPIESGVIKK